MPEAEMTGFIPEKINFLFFNIGLKRTYDITSSIYDNQTDGQLLIGAERFSHRESCRMILFP